MSTIHTRNYAFAIIEEFEEILSANHIKLPDGERLGDEDEACIFGTTYDNLEDTIVSILSKFASDVRSNPGDEIDTVFYNGFEEDIAKGANTADPSHTTINTNINDTNTNT